MHEFPFPSLISKEIIKILRSHSATYSKWMKPYIRPKEFYFLKEKQILEYSLEEFFNLIKPMVSTNGINISLDELEALMRNSNKLCLYLLFYRLGIGFGKSIRDDTWFLKLAESVFKLRLDRSKKFSSQAFQNFCLDHIDQKINVCMPVCPDYSYEKLAANKYRYTFNGIGGGIGLVASKALDNARDLRALFKDSAYIESRINIMIFIGDFEAKADNLTSLKITYEDFMCNINLSVNALSQKSGYEVRTFCSLCNGFDNWLAAEEITKIKYRLRTFDELMANYPSINHERNLISRIPLYSKWFQSKNSEDFKRVFLNQVIEYNLMGDLLLGLYGKNMCLMASDHRAMRSYYSLDKLIPTLGTPNEY